MKWIACAWTLAHAASVGAQAQDPATDPQPTAPVPSAKQPGAWERLKWAEPAPEPPLRTETGDLAGDLGWEVVGALTPAVAGIVLWVIAFEGSEFFVAPPRFAPFVGGTLLTILGPPIGVAIAGSATGGTGGAGYAFLGALIGMPLGAIGIVIGSIVAYRISADDEPGQAVSHWTLTPVIAEHEVSLQWSGRL